MMPSAFPQSSCSITEENMPPLTLKNFGADRLPPSPPRHQESSVPWPTGRADFTAPASLAFSVVPPLCDLASCSSCPLADVGASKPTLLLFAQLCLQ